MDGGSRFLQAAEQAHNNVISANSGAALLFPVRSNAAFLLLG